MNNEWEQEVHCDECGRYLFTEGIVNGKWTFIKVPKIEYKHYPESGAFICHLCEKKSDKKE